MAVETKWTKEPWSVREGELCGDPYFEIVVPNDSIAGEKVVLQTIIGDKRYPEHTAIERANATVAAVAPKLYAALYELWYDNEVPGKYHAKVTEILAAARGEA